MLYCCCVVCPFRACSVLNAAQQSAKTPPSSILVPPAVSAAPSSAMSVAMSGLIRRDLGRVRVLTSRPLFPCMLACAFRETPWSLPPCVCPFSSLFSLCPCRWWPDRLCTTACDSTAPTTSIARTRSILGTITAAARQLRQPRLMSPATSMDMRDSARRWTRAREPAWRGSQAKEHERGGRQDGAESHEHAADSCSVCLPRAVAPALMISSAASSKGTSSRAVAVLPSSAR